MPGITVVVEQKDSSAGDETQSRRGVVDVDQMPGTMVGIDQKKGFVSEDTKGTAC